jgi:hypothetical protein
MSKEYASDRKIRRGRRITALAATVALTATGCSGVRNHIDPDHNRSRVIDLFDMPETMPEAVQKNSAAVVAITGDVRLDNGKTVSHLASGVKVDQDYILSAGHIRTTEQNTPKTDFTCENVVFTGKSQRIDSYTPSFHLGREVSSFKKDDSISDIALFSPAHPELRSAPISDEPLKFGDRVFFVTYQPDLAGKKRNPAESNDIRKYPARFGGIVLDARPNSVSILTGFKNYGIKWQETFSKPGASGAPIFKDDGTIAGIVSKGVSDSAYSVERAELDYNVDIKDVPADIGLGLAIIEPVNTGMVKDLERKIVTAPPCPKIGTPWSREPNGESSLPSPTR